MIKKLALFFIGMNFGTQAMEPAGRIARKPMPPSPLKQVTTHDSDENNVEIICCPEVIKPAIIYRFPPNYPNRTLLSEQEWQDLPPQERLEWIFDRYTPDKITSINDQPLSARLKYRVRKAAVRERFYKYQEDIGYGKN